MNHISVIIPVYNVKKYLPECVEKIAEKSKYNVEIILVDDGSTDGSGELCDEYATKYENIKVLHKQNGGLGSARNVGLENATGEYIFFLDSDDYVEMFALEDLYEKASAQNLDILLFGANTFFEDEMSSKNIPKQNYTRKCCLDQVCTGLEAIREEQKQGTYITSVCLRLYKLEYLRKYNRRFNEEIIHEDIDYSFFTLLNANRVQAYEKNYYQRRYRPGSIITSSKLKKKFAGYQHVWQEYEKYINDTANDKEKIQTTIRQSEFCIHNILYILSQMSFRELREVKKQYKTIFKAAKKYNTSYKKSTKLSLSFTAACILFLKVKKNLKPLYKYYRLLRSEPFWWFKLLAVKCSKGKKRMFLFGTPVHGNAGDHLIALAEKQFIEQKFKEYKFIDFTMLFSDLFRKTIKKSITDDDVILISGGGWLGTEWPHNEIFVREIIREFQNNLIVILPQTVHYGFINTFLEEGKAVYEKHKKLIFCLRDEKSLEFVNHNFKETFKTMLLPDFALLYKGTEVGVTKDADVVKMCFRQDVEKVLSQEELNDIKSVVKDKFDCYAEFDTVKHAIIPLYRRRKFVEQTLREVREAKLVITDRLHAMIMCAMMGTPCIAYDNSSGKVHNVYKWIDKLDYIHIARRDEKISDCIDKVLKCDRQYNSSQYNGLGLMNYYEDLSDEIKRQKGQQ